MTNYPNGQDNNITLPGVSGSSDEDIAINALRSATFAIEKELGITPSGVYSDVRARFDILEARINNPVSPTILSDGFVNSPLYIVNSFTPVTLSITVGSGAPTDSRVDGSLYMRTDGYVEEGLYSRRGGVWKQVTTDPFVAAGDLSGTYLSQTVVGIRGKSLNTSLASVTATQDGYHLTWNNTDGYWEAQTGFIAGGDLTALGGPFGRTSQTVNKLQGRVVSSVAPGGTTASDGYSLVWNTTQSQWQPQVRAVIFDGYTTRTNLRSNRLFQSPVDTTKTGIVNFGSRSTGVTVGTTNNYAAILSGDKGTASGNFGLIVGGDSHTASGQYGTVVNGLASTASAQFSTVLNGNNNAATQTYAFVLDGYSNTASGVGSFVLSGSANTPAGSYTSILNGLSNSIAATVTHAAIAFGTTNQITGSTANYALILGGNNNTVTAQNTFLGTASNASIGSSYSTLLNGLSNIINTGASFSTILGGTNNVVATASGFNLIGAGQSSTVTGLYATVLNANAGTANGLHTLVLNGNTNSVTGTYSAIVNGNNNTISGNPAYGTILDGYQNTITGSGGFIADGYNNTISGFDCTILNGNNNIIAGRNSTILNGGDNRIDLNSVESTVLSGLGNRINGTANAVVSGTNNILTNSNNSLVIGISNPDIQSASSIIIGNNNTIAAGGSLNRIFGNSNTLGATASNNNVFGNSNTLNVNSSQNMVSGTSNTFVNTSHDNLVVGANNIFDNAGNSAALGATNIINASFAGVTGQYGKARLFGQQVHANSRFTAGKVGEAQASRLVLTGTAASGGAITLQLQDASPTSATFVDGYSYEMSIRVLVVNTSPISPNPVVPARYVFDVLAHCEGGVLVIDNVNLTLATPQNSGTPWTVSVSGFGSLAAPVNNQLTIQVDSEAGPPYVQPSNTPSSRRAIATIDMREISRI